MVKRVNLNGYIMKRIHFIIFLFLWPHSALAEIKEAFDRVLLHISQVSGGINPPSHAVLIYLPKGMPSSLFIAFMKQHQVFGVTGSWSMFSYVAKQHLCST